MSVTTQIKRLKETADKSKMLEIYEEIKIVANRLNFPSADFKRKVLLMLYNTIETYIIEFRPNGNNYHNSKMLDTFFVLDRL